MMKKFWNYVASFKRTLSLESHQQEEFVALHEWFRYSWWADSSRSLSDCIDALRDKVAENPLVNVAHGAGSFGVDSSGAHPTSSQRARRTSVSTGMTENEK